MHPCHAKKGEAGKKNSAGHYTPLSALIATPLTCARRHESSLLGMEMDGIVASLWYSLCRKSKMLTISISCFETRFSNEDGNFQMFFSDAGNAR